MRLLAGRAYSSGTRWCIWRWTDVVKGGSVYLTRLHLVQVPWGALMLHWIRRADPDPDMHDHPVAFASLVLRGGYVELVPRAIGEDPGGAQRTVRRFNLKNADDPHRIVDVNPRGTLTLVLAGPVTRSWGYHTEGGWVPWREYQRGR